jgi:phosphoribosyl 1,2-cyclic phosphodiesterase
MYKNATKLAKELEEKRKVLKRQLSSSTETEYFRAIFPLYPLSPENSILQTLPWGHNGFLVEFGKKKVIVDPGYDFLARTLNSDIPVNTFNTVVVSHAHIDHYASVGVMLQVMSLQEDKQINVLASKTVFEENVIAPYFSNLLGNGKKNIHSQVLQKNVSISLGEVDIYPVELFHSIQGTLGFIFTYKGVKIGYLPDTGYAKEFVTTKGVYKTGENYEGEILNIKSRHSYIKEAFSNVDTLIVSLNDFVYNKHSKYHLSGLDLIDILDKSTVKECYITHMNVVSEIHVPFLKELQQVLIKKTGCVIKIVDKQGEVINLSNDLP